MMQEQDQLINKALLWFSLLSTDQAFLLYEICMDLEEYIWTHHEDDFSDIVIKRQIELNSREDIPF